MFYIIIVYLFDLIILPNRLSRWLIGGGERRRFRDYDEVLTGVTADIHSHSPTEHSTWRCDGASLYKYRGSSWDETRPGPARPLSHYTSDQIMHASYLPARPRLRLHGATHVPQRTSDKGIRWLIWASAAAISAPGHLFYFPSVFGARPAG